MDTVSTFHYITNITETTINGLFFLKLFQCDTISVFILNSKSCLHLLHHFEHGRWLSGYISKRNLINYLKRTYNFMKMNQYWLLLENCYMHYMFFLMVLHWPIQTTFKLSCKMRELVNEKKYFYINSLKSITYIFWLYSTTLYWRSESNFQMKKEQSAHFLNQL